MKIRKQEYGAFDINSILSMLASTFYIHALSPQFAKASYDIETTRPLG